MRSTPTMITGLLLLAACSSGEVAIANRTTAPLDPTTRDSAGVTIYEHSADALERAPLITYDSTPLAVVGSDKVDEDVGGIYMLTLLADDRMAAFDNASKSVKLFSATGNLEASFGREGEGPGEFIRALQVVWSPGDTLAVTDASTSRVTLIHPDSGILSTHPVTTSTGGNSYALAGRLSNGSWLASPSGFVVVGAGATGVGEEPPPVPFGAMDLAAEAKDFERLGTVSRPATVSYRTKFQGRESEGVGIAQFAGLDKVVAWQGNAAVVRNNQWLVRLIDSNGKVVEIIRRQVSRRPSEEWMRDSVVAQKVRSASSSGNTFQSAEDIAFSNEHRPMADSLPHFEDASTTPRGLLWLKDFELPGATTVWATAIDSEGRIVGRLELPVPASWTVLGDDRVILREVDGETGVVSFKVHKLNF